MSDFLLNLARRSAGLTPVVQSRMPTAVDGIALPAAEATEPESSASIPRQAGGLRETHAPAAIAAASPPMPVAAPIVLQPLSVPSAPVVQREATAAAPVPSPAMPSQPSTPPPAASKHGGSVQVPHPAPEAFVAIKPAVTPRLPEPSAPPRSLLERHTESRIERETTRIIEPAAAPPGEVVRVEVHDRELHHDREPAVVELVPAAIALAAPTGSVAEPPSEVPVASRPTAVEPSSIVERTVQVRIGTIEIQGSNASGVAAPPAAAPAPVVEAAQGFDDFARLRSYAQWAW